MSSQTSSAGRVSGNGDANPNRWEPVVPIPVGTGPVPARRNVDKWLQAAEDGDATALELSLFIRAMTTFQKLGLRDQLSYFRIAGLHGFPPNVSWNMDLDPIARNDPQLQDKIEHGEGGAYCMHNQYKFGTWHRVYMILFERRVSDLMKEELKVMKIKNEQDKAAWEAAADRWRLPYWDWAAIDRLPKLVCNENITIVTNWNGGTGTPETTSVPNPMYRFQMPGGRAMGDPSYGDYRIDPDSGLPFDLCVGTTRHGISWYTEREAWIKGITNVDQVNAALEHPDWNDEAPPIQTHDTIKDAVQRLLNPYYNASWEQFISTKFQGQQDDPMEFMSLEAIHNNIHDWTGGADATEAGGGGGHMCSVPVAAFDPVFWLHHSNIDRIIYLWQIIKENQDKWFNAAEGDEDDDAKTPLRPFRNPKRPVDFYDSNMVRSLRDLNYTYDDILAHTQNIGLSLDMPLEESLPDEKQLAKHINGLYGDGLPTVSPPQGAEHPGAEKVDFIVNVVYNRYALSGLRYTIRVFIGKDCVGSIHTFSTPIKDAAGFTRCPQCEKQSENKILSRAQVPILRAVRHRVPPTAGENAEAYTKRVDEYLEKRLRCVAMLDSGAQIPRMALPDVKVTVLAGKFRPRRADEEWVRFSDHVQMPKATAKFQG